MTKKKLLSSMYYEKGSVPTCLCLPVRVCTQTGVARRQDFNSERDNPQDRLAYSEDEGSEFFNPVKPLNEDPRSVNGIKSKILEKFEEVKMRKIIFCALIIAGLGFAGENETESISAFNFLVGLKTGANYDVAHSLSEDTRRWDGLGYNIGLEFETNLKNIIDLTIGCSYLRTAYTNKTLGGFYSEDSTYSYNNLYIPIVMKLVLKIGGRVHPFVKIGAAGVFELSGRIKGWIEPAPFDIEIDSLVNNYYFLTGLGTDIQISSKLKLRPVFTYQRHLNLWAADTPYDIKKSFDCLFTVGVFYSVAL